MDRIKTRETVKNIKFLDKSAVLSQSIRQTFVRSKTRIEETINNENHSSASEYAENYINNTARTISQHSSQIVRAGERLISHSLPSSPAAHKSSDYLRGQDLAKTQFKKDYAVSRDIKLRDASQVFKHSSSTENPKRASSKSDRSIKTAEKTSKTKIKTSKTVAKSHHSGNTSRNLFTSKSSNRKAKKETLESMVKAIVSGIKSLYAAIVAGGWVSVVIIVLLCVIGLLLASPLGVLFSGDSAQDEMQICDVVRVVNEEFEDKISEIRSNNEFDKFVMEGVRTPWKEVLAIYAVSTSAGSSQTEVVTMDEHKKQLLMDTFWTMNGISYRIETELVPKTVLVETEDGNLVEHTEEIEEHNLIITINGKTAGQMADGLNFNSKQKELLNTLLDDEFSQMWTSVIYGVNRSNYEIVAVALSQLGNVGGQPYWSWYGFSSRVEWCACFVSWCANECGYIDTGIIPKFAWCPHGAQWFKDRGRWMDNSAEPTPGMIIFFDWDKPSTKGPDGVTDHVAIVERVEDGYVYTIEGNSGDCCRQKKYAVGHYEIYGYGAPEY